MEQVHCLSCPCRSRAPARLHCRAQQVRGWFFRNHRVLQEKDQAFCLLGSCIGAEEIRAACAARSDSRQTCAQAPELKRTMKLTNPDSKKKRILGSPCRPARGQEVAHGALRACAAVLWSRLLLSELIDGEDAPAVRRGGSRRRAVGAGSAPLARSPQHAWRQDCMDCGVPSFALRIRSLLVSLLEMLRLANCDKRKNYAASELK